MTRTHSKLGKVTNPTFGDKKVTVNDSSRWWFQIFLEFSPLFGEDEPILTNIFQRGWFNHQPALGFVFLGDF